MAKEDSANMDRNEVEIDLDNDHIESDTVEMTNKKSYSKVGQAASSQFTEFCFDNEISEVEIKDMI